MEGWVGCQTPWWCFVERPAWPPCRSLRCLCVIPGLKLPCRKAPADLFPWMRFRMNREGGWEGVDFLYPQSCFSTLDQWHDWSWTSGPERVLAVPPAPLPWRYRMGQSGPRCHSVTAHLLSCRHMVLLKEQYGKQVVVNLLGSRGGEEVLNRAFKVTNTCH